MAPAFQQEDPHPRLRRDEGYQEEMRHLLWPLGAYRKRRFQSAASDSMYDITPRLVLPLARAKAASDRQTASRARWLCWMTGRRRA